MEIIIKLLVAGAIMGVLDALWLGVIANKLYKSQIGHVLADKPNFVAAVVFYLIYVIGVVFFVITPALEKDSWEYAVGAGALFGLVAYATYELTNLATLKKWPIKIVIIDLLWGTLLTSVVAGLSYTLLQSWLPL